MTAAVALHVHCVRTGQVRLDFGFLLLGRGGRFIQVEINLQLGSYGNQTIYICIYINIKKKAMKKVKLVREMRHQIPGVDAYIAKASQLSINTNIICCVFHFCSLYII